jgi:tetratricopeptide (TPR) repeat protein
LSSQHELARTYEVNGQVREAVALLAEVVRTRERTLAADHPDRLASQHALAGAYRENGQLEKAVALLTDMAQIREA